VNTWIRDALFALVLISVVWAIRSALPSDLWKRSQPLTLRATVDVAVEDRWILPHTVDDRPLAKPPLVNWLSAPIVEAFGFTAWSHRLVPAMAALLTCLFTMRLARMFHTSDAVVYSSALLFIGTWLGYKSLLLVRPDPLLVLASTLGVWSILARMQGMRWASAVLCCAIGVGWLAKGIAVLPLILLACWAPRIARVPRSDWPRSPAWIIVVATVPYLVWLVATELVHPGFPADVLLGEEILGRMSGTGAEAAGRSPWQLLFGIWKLPVHFVLRTLPISIFAILAWRKLPRNDLAVLLFWFVLLHLLVFGFSASRRADWMMPAVPALSVLAACRWCVNWRSPFPASLALCAFMLAVMGWNEMRTSKAWTRPLESFANQAREKIVAQPAPVLVVGNDRNHLVGLLGLSGVDHHEPTSKEVLEHWLDASVSPGEGFWIVAGDRPAFGTQPPQRAVDGVGSWGHLEGPVHWMLEVEGDAMEYMWPGALRLGWARRRQ
jgi:4-amino-4-deoxy-L-arabinose transferase-like glycosyltransferase